MTVTSNRLRRQLGMQVFLMGGFAARVCAQAPFFSSSPPIPIESNSNFLLADFNKDGQLDILTRDAAGQGIALYVGDGKGGFATAPDQRTRLDFEPGMLAQGDVNADGVPDIAIATRDADKENVRIFLRTREGRMTMAAGSPFTTRSAIESYKPVLRFADIDKDGKLDLVTANERGSSVEVSKGDGTGRFSAPIITRLEPGRWTYSFDLADVDADGQIDLITTSGMVVSDLVPGHLSIHRGLGNGAFVAPAEAAQDVLSDPRVAEVADLNGDGLPDIVLSHGNVDALTVVLNGGLGKFKARVQVHLRLTAFTVAVSDINRDGKPDLVALTADSRNDPHESRFEILLGDGAGAFKAAESSPFRAAAATYRFTAGDINGDGNLDLVSTSFGAKSLSVLYGR